MSCNCEVCKFSRAFQARLEKMSDDDKDFFNIFYEKYINESDERDYYKAIVQNKWPDGDKILARYRNG